MSEDLKIKQAEKITTINPTQEQINEGSYQKGTLTLKNFRIAIESPVGSIRRGIDPKGKMWESKINHTYGYFVGTMGNDGDEVDVFIGSEIDNDFDIYVIDQVNPNNREFDEHKVMFGFKDEKHAKASYLSNYEDGWLGYNNITSFTISKFRQWLYDSKK